MVAASERFAIVLRSLADHFVIEFAVRLLGTPDLFLGTTDGARIAREHVLEAMGDRVTHFFVDQLLAKHREQLVY